MNTFVIDSLKLENMISFIRDVKKSGIPIIMVASPQYGTINSDAFYPIKALCGEFDVPFIDFYTDKDFVYNKDFFYDPAHLNDIGAKKYTRKLIAQLKTAYFN